MRDDLSELLHDEDARGHFESFTYVEVRVMSLCALGWRTVDIGKYLHLNEANILKSCRSKTGVTSKEGLGLAYIARLLPFDVLSGYKLPGEKYRAWLAVAEKRREQLLNGLLSPKMREAVMVQATLGTVDLPNVELAKLMSRPTAVNTYSDYLTRSVVALRGIIEIEQSVRLKPAPIPHGRGRLLSVAYLAPLV